MQNPEGAHRKADGTLQAVADVARPALLVAQLGFRISLAIGEKRERIVDDRMGRRAAVAYSIGGAVVIGQIERTSVVLGPLGFIVAHAVPRCRAA